jgi:GTP-binding protein
MRARRPATAPRDRRRPPEERSLTAVDPFVGSFPRADTPLHPPLPEVALIGRSNVGKSSLLNAMVRQRIAKVSGTPGKTRAMNVFRLTFGAEFYLLDLPGYGFARVSKSDRELFRQLLGQILVRPRLAGVVWLLDLRHDPSALDQEMQDTLAAGQKRVLAAFTKADKLPRGQRMQRARELGASLRMEDDQTVTTSAETGEGMEELRKAVALLVRADNRT